MSNNLINDINNQLEVLFSNKEIKKFLMSINFILQDHSIPLSELYNLLGKLFRKNPDFFMDKLYRDIHMYGKIFNSPSQIYELERKILEKYCFFEEETLIKKFTGTISAKDAYVDGKIYITNKRIIIQGILNLSQSIRKTIQYPRLKMFRRIFGYENISKSYFLPFTHKPRQNFLPLTPCFGYQIPFLPSYNIIKKKKYLTYTTIYKVKYENVALLQPVSFKITPSPSKSKKRENFKLETKEILSLLEDTIKKYSII